MPRLTFLGWREGLQTIAMMKLLRNHAGLDLMQAKTFVEEVIKGKHRSIELESFNTIQQLAHESDKLGMNVEVENEKEDTAR